MIELGYKSSLLYYNLRIYEKINMEKDYCLASSLIGIATGIMMYNNHVLKLKRSTTPQIL